MLIDQLTYTSINTFNYIKLLTYAPTCGVLITVWSSRNGCSGHICYIYIYNK